MEAKKFYTLEEIEDKYIGEKGTPKRDAYEEELNSFLIGEAIKQARQSKNLTQEELGNLIGVQRAQISRIENGKNLTFSTIARVFKAMGISAKLEIGSMGKLALWSLTIQQKVTLNPGCVFAPGNFLFYTLKVIFIQNLTRQKIFLIRCTWLYLFPLSPILRKFVVSKNTLKSGAKRPL